MVDLEDTSLVVQFWQVLINFLLNSIQTFFFTPPLWESLTTPLSFWSLALDSEIISIRFSSANSLKQVCVSAKSKSRWSSKSAGIGMSHMTYQAFCAREIETITFMFRFDRNQLNFAFSSWTSCGPKQQRNCLKWSQTKSIRDWEKWKKKIRSEIQS